MPIDGLNHFNIIAPPDLMAAAKDFYLNVIGLAEGYRPDFGIAGHWLYAGSAPVLHLMDADALQWQGAPGSDEKGTGHLDHIAFSASDLAATEIRLTNLGLDYRKSEFPDFKLTQLFLHDPIGLGVELNFSTP
jgi:catechol 2,3-dioxygenase-like lactoylglutathione lyase family enzyme